MPDFNDPAVLQMYLDKGYGLATGLLLAIAILAVGWIVAKWAQRLTIRSASKLDAAVGRFGGNIIRYVVLAAAVIAALEAVGVKTTSLLAIFGAAGLAVGLALQGSLSNFASGVMILIFRPFQLEDIVEVGGKAGVVTDVGLFASTLRTPDNHVVIVPNSSVTGSVITNFTKLGQRRGTVDVGVGYGCDLKAVQEACMAAAAKIEVVLTDPAPQLVFTEMAASSLNFQLRVWCEAANFQPMLHQVRSAVYDELNERGIEIPFNQIVVHQADAA